MEVWKQRTSRRSVHPIDELVDGYWYSCGISDRIFPDTSAHQGGQDNEYFLRGEIQKVQMVPSALTDKKEVCTLD